MDENFLFGSPAEIIMGLGDPDSGWDAETRLVAAGHILTAWQEDAALSTLYEIVRHASGSTDERTVHDLGVDDVFEIATRIWGAVADGELLDPRHPSTLGIHVMPIFDEEDLERQRQRAERFEATLHGLPLRLIEIGLASENLLDMPTALPDIHVVGFLLANAGADFLDDISPDDAALLRAAGDVFVRLFDLAVDIEEAEGPGDTYRGEG